MGETRYRAVSLFSGAMGLDLGIERSGRFEVLACVEKEPAFCETIRVNQRAGRLDPDLRVYQGDIADPGQVDPYAIMRDLALVPGELDLLVGGPPCQSFSTAGRRRTTRDARGTLLWQFLRYVEVFQPKFFLIENVRGLLSAALRHRPIARRPEKGGAPLASDEEPGSVIRLFADDLQRTSGGAYHMDCFEVNAVNYGAPQLRERVLLMGNRFGHVVDFPDPTHGPQAGLLPWRTLGDALSGMSEPGTPGLDFSPRKKRYLAMVPPGSNWRSLPVEVQQESMGKAWAAKGGRSGWWRRLNFDLPCPTLVTMPNHAGTSLCHPTEVRALTLREYSAIQEFPAEWEFAGTPAEQYAQAGNAVPVRLGLIAGTTVAGALDAVGQSVSCTLHEPRAAYRVVYVQSHVRTRQWYRSGRTFVRDGREPGSASAYGAPKTIRKVRPLHANVHDETEAPALPLTEA